MSELTTGIAGPASSGRLDLWDGPPPPPPPAEVSPGVSLDTLVDAVVERIERRVVDELERRGRRNGRGAF